MDEVKRTCNDNDDQVKMYSHIVKQLQESENRNDDFIKKLLSDIENLGHTKLGNDEYQKDAKVLDMKFDSMDNAIKHNHNYLTQMENFIEKFLPIKV